LEISWGVIRDPPHQVHEVVLILVLAFDIFADVLLLGKMFPVMIQKSCSATDCQVAPRFAIAGAVLSYRLAGVSAVLGEHRICFFAS